MSFAAALQAYRDADYAKSGALLESAMDADASALRSMSAVRRVQSVGETHHNLNLDTIQDSLGTTLSTPQLEGERLFIRGWLSWLDGAFANAAGFLAESVHIHRDNQESSARTEAAYWLARVRIQLRQKDAIAQYEEELRTLGGLPQSVAWFADLLWRARLPDRAQQVWKTVRGNPRIAACDDSFLIDARFHLHRAELDRADQGRASAAPRGGVLKVERLLYLALTKLKRQRLNEAAEFIHQAKRGPYPASALQKWRRLLPPSPETGQPPSDVEPGAWRLHQASLA